jgi:phasin family protein
MAKTTTKPRTKSTTKSSTKPATKPGTKATTKTTTKATTKPTTKPTTRTDTSASKTTAASFAGVTKLLKQFKLPGVDINALIATQRKDIEALAAANQQAYEGMQSLAKRQTEILRETMEAWQEAAKELAGKSLSESAEIRTALAKSAFVKALGNMRDLAEMAIKSQAQVLEGLKKRAQENLEELKNLLQPK